MAPRQALLVIITLSVAAFGFSLLGLILPNTYTNRYVADAFYFLNAAYLIHHGYVPHIDFVWQFGGFESYIIALAYALFGVSFKGIEQAIAIAFWISAALLILGVGRQARVSTFALLLLLLTATTLSWFPFEDGDIDMEGASFAMYYNRICWSLAMVVYATLLLSSERLKQLELFACAAAAFLILATKITFLLLLVPAVAPLLHRNGVKGLLQCMFFTLALGASGWVFLGFSPEAYLLFASDLADATGDKFNMDWALRKLFYISAYNIFEIAIAAVGLAWLWHSSPDSRWARLKALVLASALLLSLLVTVTTGTLDYFISARTPIFAFIAILCADQAFKRKGGAQVFAAALGFYSVAFSTPYLMNHVLGLRSQARLGEQALFTEGSLQGLIIDRPRSSRTPLFPDRQSAIRYIAARNSIEGGTQWLTDYEWQFVHADALALAQQLPDVRRRRVLTFYPSVMPFALQAAPITSFPLSASDGAPSVRALRELPVQVDTVLVLRDDATNPLRRRFAPSLQRDFALRRRSTLWDLYVRLPAAAEVGARNQG